MKFFLQDSVFLRILKLIEVLSCYRKLRILNLCGVVFFVDLLCYFLGFGMTGVEKIEIFL